MLLCTQTKFVDFFNLKKKTEIVEVQIVSVSFLIRLSRCGW